MSTRWPTQCLCAALLVFGMVALTTGKPPDLPAADKVNCKDNPAVREYGSEAVPAGAAELQEGVEPAEVEMTPIDTLYPWLDALIRACEERAEVWFEDTTVPGLRATASHTVQVVADDENPPARIDAPKGVICPVGWMGPEPCCETSDPLCRSVRACCASINRIAAACARQCQTNAAKPSFPRVIVHQTTGGTVILFGDYEAKPMPSADPVCRSVRACCGCINRVVARCANEARYFVRTGTIGATAGQRSSFVIESVSPEGIVLVKWRGVLSEKTPTSGTCPVCQSFRACCGQIQCAVRVCVKNAHTCMNPCQKCDPSESAEPSKSESTSPCPWMREKNAKPTAPSRAAMIPATPLDNLKKLEQARAMLKVADQCQQAGKVERARMIYARVRALVPGSRLDAVAEQQIEAIAAAQAEEIRDRAAILRARGKAIVAEESEQPAKPATPAQSTCPFILLKKVVIVPATPAGFPNALDNLKKLEQAQEMLDNAENCLKEGMLDQAMALFRQIHLVCPGSPVDRRASEQGEALSAKLGEARVLLSDALRLVLTQKYDEACDLYAKLEELLPNSIYAQIASEHRGMIQYIGAAFRPAAEEQAESKPCCVEAKVAELLEDCQRALTAGEFDKAAKLAKKAQKLDGDSVAANALVYKAHLLIQLREKQQAEREKCGKVGACEPLCPRMPGIDPAVVRDIERAIQVREEAIAKQRRKKEASQTEEAEPKKDDTEAPAKDADDDSPQARSNAVEESLAGLLGIMHDGTGVEIALAMNSVRFEYHAPAVVMGLMSAIEGIQKPRIIICGEEEERTTGLRNGVAP